MEKKSEKNIMIAFLLNLLFSIIELVGGVFTNSISIITDSIHDFGDALSIGISYFLEKKSNKKPDDNYSYGYLRYSVLGALITSMILLVGSIIVLYNTIPRLINPQKVNYDGMIILAIIGFVINGIAVLKTAKSNNINEKAINLHMLEDVLGWIAVLIGSIVIKFTGLYIVDPILSIGITIFILINVIKNVKEILNLFLEKTPKDLNNKKIEEILKDNKKIEGIHHIHIWSLDGINNYLTLHVIVNESIKKEELIELKKYIKHQMEHLDILHTTIEFEYNDENCMEKFCNVKHSNIDSHHHH